MAATTRELAKSGLAVAVLNFDDATLLATGVTIANISGTEIVQFTITISGQTFSRTVGIGQTSILNFPSSIAVTLGTSVKGQPTLSLAGLESYGMGSG